MVKKGYVEPRVERPTIDSPGATYHKAQSQALGIVNALMLERVLSQI